MPIVQTLDSKTAGLPNAWTIFRSDYADIGELLLGLNQIVLYPLEIRLLFRCFSR